MSGPAGTVGERARRAEVVVVTLQYVERQGDNKLRTLFNPQFVLLPGRGSLGAPRRPGRRFERPVPISRQSDERKERADQRADFFDSRCRTRRNSGR